MAKAQLPTYPSTTTTADDDLFHLNQSGLDKKLTVGNLKTSLKSSATESSAGIAEIATQGEVDAGVDDERIVTALKLANTLPVQSSPTVSGIVELALDVEAIAGVDTERALTPSNVEAKIAEEAELGIIEIADSTEIVAGVDNTKVISPIGLDNLQASTDQASIIGIATQDEADAGNDNTKAITPLTMNNAVTQNASEVKKGKIERATQGEVDAGLDDERAITPLKMATVFNLLSVEQATESVKGVAELSTQVETDTGVDDTTIITPLKLQSRLATEVLEGFVGLAIDATDTLNITDTITPKDLADVLSPIATDAVVGITELATSNEVRGGTSTSRSITPEGLSNRVATESSKGLIKFADAGQIDHSVGLDIASTLAAKSAQDFSDFNFKVDVNVSDIRLLMSLPGFIGGRNIQTWRILFVPSDFTANIASRPLTNSSHGWPARGVSTADGNNTPILSVATVPGSPTEATDNLFGIKMYTSFIGTGSGAYLELFVNSSDMTSVPTNGFQVIVTTA